MHTCTHTYICTYIHTYVHTYIHTHISTGVHTCIHTCIHTCMIHTCMHPYIHTYIHTYMYIRNYCVCMDTSHPLSPSTLLTCTLSCLNWTSLTCSAWPDSSTLHTTPYALFLLKHTHTGTSTCLCSKYSSLLIM